MYSHNDSNWDWQMRQGDTNEVKTKGSSIKSRNTIPSIFDFLVETLEGEQLSLEKYRGKVILIENVASL